MTNDLNASIHMPVFVAIDERGAKRARTIMTEMPGATLHGLTSRVSSADQGFAHVAEHLAALFQNGQTIVGVMASGILIRSLGGLALDKHEEPPVLALSQDGRSVVPLLGGHHGGNQLALKIAKITGGEAAITTAGDVALGVALDDPPLGWRVSNPDAAKGIAASFLAGEPISLKSDQPCPQWLSSVPFSDAAPKSIRVTAHRVNEPRDDLVFHPPRLALGVGCERGCEPSELISLCNQTLDINNLSPQAIGIVVSLDVKMDEEAVHEVAAHFGVPLRFFDAATLEAETPRLHHPSDIVFSEVGCHGVAEAAALAAVGDNGTLIQPKRKSSRATAAVAISNHDLSAYDIGKSRGRLTIVGNGPGSEAWRSPEATRALRDATDIVGYQLYLDLVADLIVGKTQHQSALSEEEARCRQALELAANGKAVALVCSGDAGIYALASLVFELLDREDRAEWNRLDISVAPGISAFQAAGARMGAPFGHDFCTISLSDLLTPWTVIEERLIAAAKGDFIVAFYNPVSKRRRTQLQKAKEILLQARPPETPVVLGRNLGRKEEELKIITLGELAVDDVDMLTTVVVGNKQTKHIKRGVKHWVYTPRGYAAKMDNDKGTRSSDDV